MNRSVMIDTTILIVMIIFFNFFSFIPVSENALIGKGIIVSGFILATISVYYLFFKARPKLLLHDKLVLGFILTFFVSSFMAKIFWGQAYFSSFKSIFYFNIFFIYFVLLSLEVPADRIKTIIKVIFFITLIVFLIDLKTFPNPLFSWRDEERRGGMTVFFYGQGFTFLGAFYFLEQCFSKKRITFLALFLAAFSLLFFMTYSRMILIGLVLGALFLFLKSSLRYKYLITMLLIAGLFIIYYRTDVLKGIKNENKTQIEYYKDNIRLQSQRFFLFELQGGVPTILFGNGIPGKSGSLRQAIEEGRYLGYFNSDVGLTGIYSYFGILGAVIWILFFFVVFKSKEDNYIKAYFLALLATIFTGYSLFDPGYMPSTILALYLVRIKNTEGENACLEEKISKDECCN